MTRSLVDAVRHPLTAFLRSVARVSNVALACSALAGFAVPSGSRTDGVPLREAVELLAVHAEVWDGYDRGLFRHWVDSDGDGCSTRAEVLLAEAVEPPEVTARCTLSGGRWYSSFDNTYVDDLGDLDIDHLVPLAEAWDSGAYGWSSQRRQDYANDLAEGATLVAVTSRANRSKADKDPHEWLPPYGPAVCRYIADWVAVKIRWHLDVDHSERNALIIKADDCTGQTVTTTRGARGSPSLPTRSPSGHAATDPPRPLRL